MQIYLSDAMGTFSIIINDRSKTASCLIEYFLTLNLLCAFNLEWSKHACPVKSTTSQKAIKTVI